MNIQCFKPIKWWYWLAGILLLTSGVGVGALIFIMQIPQAFDCISESGVKDSTASVIYCATTTVDEQDAASLSRVIELVDSIPKDNPLRHSGDRLIEKWSEAILRLSEKAFQEGDLHKAVNTAKLIPVNMKLHPLANEQIKKWQSTWSKAEAIYQAAEEKMQEREDNNRSHNWYVALTKAKELKNLDNNYWATTKYPELVHNIQDIRERNEQGEKKEEKVKKDLEPITQVDVEQKESDLAQLKKAKLLASSGKIEDMRDAITEAHMVYSDVYFQEAQKFIATIQGKIEISEDRDYLKNAQKSASKNDVISLQMAIGEASMITKERPLYKEANQDIGKWNKQILQLTAQIEKQNQTKVPINQKFKLDTVDNSQVNQEIISPASQINTDTSSTLDTEFNDTQVENPQLDEAR
ncbi:MAG: hypothetical protein KME60_14835 [Cyanomargarita calcarea GSE-NOS-MK-12-04C]|jgi:hypothetical protein|uniref:Chromosome segregation ATPase n=1 Tax=Cyanomargarita calcarea GSE-NOS-MK-12-04C TaxID=2839659 RepID=A0A951QMG5_9CYAN|nr:hypothetical protein [Cyanomargarita calcarea GSE-NOS-MK-12-04C]